MEVRSIASISHIESIDLVFEPTADDRILHALSAHFVSQSVQSVIKSVVSIQDRNEPFLNDLSLAPQSADSIREIRG